MTETKYTGELKSDKKNVVSKQNPKRFEIQFTQNRSFELRIGRRDLYFSTDNRTAIISAEELAHPDFKQQQRYFSVKEV